MKEFLKFLGFVVLVFGSMGAFGFGMSKWSCSQLEEQAFVSTKYQFPSGCYVFVNDTWIPSDVWLENTGN